MAFELGLRRSTVLADARLRGLGDASTAAVTHVGADAPAPFRYGHADPYVARRPSPPTDPPADDSPASASGVETSVGTFVAPAFVALWNPFVGAAYGVYELGKLVPFPKFGNDTVGYMGHVDSSVDGLWNDVVNDAKGQRTALCVKDRESKGLVVDAKSVLQCAGIKSPTVDQVKAFGTCFNERKDGDRASREVMGDCADLVAAASGVAPLNKSHTDNEWRQAFVGWIQDWRAYMNKNNVDAPFYRPTKEELDTWYAQLEGKGGWRDLFVQRGGRTINPAAPSPKDVPSLFTIPTWVYWLGGAALVAFILVQGKALLPSTWRTP